MSEDQVMKAFGDHSLKAAVTLDERQREAFETLTAGYPGSVGLVDLGECYYRIDFYNPEGETIHSELLWGNYGDAVMPQGPAQIDRTK